MTFKILKAAALVSSALALAALAPSAASALALKPGHYMIAGIQPICIVNGGTWYGEAYPFGGNWSEGPSGQTVIFGNYNGGAGNDSMITTRKAVQWTEWSDGLAFQTFVTGSVVRLTGHCAAPATLSPPKHKNPTD